METADNKAAAAAIAQARQGSATATYDLVFVHYKDALARVINKVVRRQDDAEIYVWLGDFYFYLTTPTQKGEVRLRNLSIEGNPTAYLQDALHKWLLSELDRRREHLKRHRDIDQAAPGTTDEADRLPVERKQQDERRMEALLTALEQLRKMSIRDRFILLTYMKAELNKGQGAPLHVARQLARQLGMTEGAVKMSYKRSKEQLRRLAMEQLGLQ